MVLCSFAIALTFSVTYLHFSFLFVVPLLYSIVLLQKVLPSHILMLRCNFSLPCFKSLLPMLMDYFCCQLLSPSHPFHFNLIWKNSKFVLILSSIHSQHKIDSLCNFMEKSLRLIILLSWHRLIVAISKNGEENNYRRFFFS